jgi:hypothetical protein
MSNVKVQISNEAQNPNDQKNLIKFFNPLSAICDLQFRPPWPFQFEHRSACW